MRKAKGPMLEAVQWYQGKVTKVVNPKTDWVRIKWDDNCVVEGDNNVTDQLLKACCWNIKNPREGS